MFFDDITVGIYFCFPRINGNCILFERLNSTRIVLLSKSQSKLDKSNIVFPDYMFSTLQNESLTKTTDDNQIPFYVNFWDLSPEQKCIKLRQTWLKIRQQWKQASTVDFRT